MSRIKRGVTTRAKHKRLLEQAKGYRGRSSNCYRIAKQSVEKALQYAYRDRKTKKRQYRNLWKIRINAACRDSGISYSSFMNGLKEAKVEVNRKVLAELAISSPAAFKKLVKLSKDTLGEKTAKEKKKKESK